MGDEMESGDKSENISKIFGDILFGGNDKIIENLKMEYTKALVSALTLTNVALTMHLYYLTVFKEDKESTLKVFDNLMDEAHEEIASALIKTIKDGDEIPFFKERTDELIQQFIGAMDLSREEIRSGLRTSFESSIRLFSRCSTATPPGTPTGTGDTEGDSRGNSTGSDNN